MNDTHYAQEKVQEFADALKKHLGDELEAWAPEREGGDTEAGFWTVGNVVDMHALNEQIDKFAAEFDSDIGRDQFDHVSDILQRRHGMDALDYANPEDRKTAIRFAAEAYGVEG